MVGLSAIVASSVNAHYSACPTIIVLWLIHRALTSESRGLLHGLGSRCFELQGGLEPWLLRVVAKAGFLVPLQLILSLRNEFALAVIFQL